MNGFMFDKFPEIETERLVLREINKQDSKSIFDILSNSKVIEKDSFELFTRLSQAEELIEVFTKLYNQKKAIFWGICFKDTSEILGFCKCELEIPKVRADLGYDLGFDFWNKGIMTEALAAVINFTFHKLEINRIEASVSTKNLGSIRVLEKCGFIEEGIMRQRCFWKGEYEDMMMLSLLKKEYIRHE